MPLLMNASMGFNALDLSDEEYRNCLRMGAVAAKAINMRTAWAELRGETPIPLPSLSS